MTGKALANLMLYEWRSPNPFGECHSYNIRFDMRMEGSRGAGDFNYNNCINKLLQKKYFKDFIAQKLNYMHNSFTISPAIISPATEGTKEILAGICLLESNPSSFTIVLAGSSFE